MNRQIAQLGLLVFVLVCFVSRLFSRRNQTLQASYLANSQYLPRYRNDRIQKVNVIRGWDDGTFNCSVVSRTKTLIPFQMCLFEPSTDKYVSRSVAETGLWEPRITAAFTKVLTLYPTATVIDAGAHVGYYSLLAARLGHKTVSIEPNGASIELLQQSASANNLTSFISICNNALSDHQYFSHLSRSQNNQGALHLMTPSHIALHPKRRLQRSASLVEVITLDDVAALITTCIVVLKIDIEGYECRLFPTKILTHFRVPYVFMEWGRMKDFKHKAFSACPSAKMREMAHYFAQLNYVPFEARTGIQLDASIAVNWRVGDVYWRLKNEPKITSVL